MVPLVMLRTAILLAFCLGIAACATTPLDTSRVDSRATPAGIVEAMPGEQSARVHWGGRIVAITNLEQSTLIEMLSYPLARDGFPNTFRNPTGRFVLRHDGFLEPLDHAPGRLLTVVGTVRSLTRVAVGETELVVPLVRAEQLKLWDDRYEGRTRPRFGFGVGINVGF